MARQHCEPILQANPPSAHGKQSAHLALLKNADLVVMRSLLLQSFTLLRQHVMASASLTVYLQLTADLRGHGRPMGDERQLHGQCACPHQARNFLFRLRCRRQGFPLVQLMGAPLLSLPAFWVSQLAYIAANDSVNVTQGHASLSISRCGIENIVHNSGRSAPSDQIQSVSCMFVTVKDKTSCKHCSLC